MGIGQRPKALSKNHRQELIAGMGEIAQFLSRLSQMCEHVMDAMEERRIEVHRDRIKQTQLELQDLISTITPYNEDVAEVIKNSEILKFHMGRLHLRTNDKAGHRLLFNCKDLIGAALECRWHVPFRLVLE